MKILISGASFLPNYGGPAVSIPSLAVALTQFGVDVGIWAPDGSALSARHIQAPEPIFKLDGTFEEALLAFGRPNILHDNGIWLPYHHAISNTARKNGVARIVSVRGMLEPWSIQHKSIKKKIAWLTYQRRDLQHAKCLVATAESEAINLRSYGLGTPVYTVPNGVELPQKPRFAWRNSRAISHRKTTLKKTALFLGRIHPKKGLPMLLEAWAKLRPIDWSLDIAGPDEGGHRKEVEALARNHGIENSIRFLGEINPSEKSEIYSTADLFVLPTYSENFGMVVAEALANGVPVLTTRGAPWQLLIEQRCGWWVEVSVEGIANGLRQVFSCTTEELGEMGARGRALVESEFSWRMIATRMLKVYEEVLSGVTGRG